MADQTWLRGAVLGVALGVLAIAMGCTPKASVAVISVSQLPSQPLAYVPGQTFDFPDFRLTLKKAQWDDLLLVTQWDIAAKKGKTVSTSPRFCSEAPDKIMTCMWGSWEGKRSGFSLQPGEKVTGQFEVTFVTEGSLIKITWPPDTKDPPPIEVRVTPPDRLLPGA